MSMKTRDLEAGDKIWGHRHIDDSKATRYERQDYREWTILSNEKVGDHKNKISMTDGQETVEVTVSSYWEVCLIEPEDSP